ncbi:hypothetical protein SAMN02745216_01835 [Desulfatibacillum alkenivorans DSM 16219]|jgi:hypothetical protein|uniref:MxaA protein n=1 Tax=Desulfatibacillum alkenivorans DSM 16219 TaxID=1121393 RepID=A0A1M6K155_9BACT|nr:hypothetical protein [Desulfatibacillum alkenivorans]SHJ52647.1 hypothetical protein SAMN02745216_01835 [Desulfatibacillum alkenivorans DSM 16219]
MKRSLNILLILLIFLFSSAPLWADETAKAQPSWNARFLAEKAVLGEPVSLSLEASLPEGAALTDPAEITGLDDLVILDKKRTKNGLELSLLVNSLDSFKVPGFSVAFINKDGARQWLDFSSQEIQVDNGLPDDPSKLQPRPIKGLIPGKSFFSKYAPWIGAGLLLLALAAFALWFYLRSRRIQTLEIQTAAPHEVALENLDKLESWWASKGEDKEGYFRLSAIVRAYMGAIRPFPAEELTTSEIRARVREREDREIMPLLEEADMVKFAKARIAEATRKEHIAMARDYVNKTCSWMEEVQEVQAEVVDNEVKPSPAEFKGKAE